MDYNKVVLNLPQLYENWLYIYDMKYVLRFQNNFNTKVQLDYPTKFTCGFLMYTGFIESTFKKTELFVKELGMQLLCLPIHYINSILVHNTISFEPMVCGKKGASQIILDIDNPYPIEEIESEKQSSYPDKLLDLAIIEEIINKK